MLASAFTGFPVWDLGPWKVHPHVVFETLAYAVAFRIYLWIRRRYGDVLPNAYRWWLIAAAVLGAVVGSRILHWFEDPRLTLANWNNPVFLFGGKTIVGARIGGLFAVELVKKQLGSGDERGICLPFRCAWELQSARSDVF
jgi:phosphatidylglycerol---prolipoprotein diacylglyceryl transferase